MPLTSRPGEMAGNIPLILVASDTDGTSNNHPMARPFFYDLTTRPCIASSELKGSLHSYPAKRFAIWLPTPTYANHKAQRNLVAAWDMSISPGNMWAYAPQFQVCAISQPSRPSNGDTKFSAWAATTKNLSAVTTNASGTVTNGSGVLEIRNITAPVDDAIGDAAITPEATCYLVVWMPTVQPGNFNSVIFKLLGVGLDQW